MFCLLPVLAMASTNNIVSYSYSSQAHQVTTISQAPNSQTYLKTIGGKTIQQAQNWSSISGDALHYHVDSNSGLKLHSHDDDKHWLSYQYNNAGINQVTTHDARINYIYNQFGQMTRITRSQGFATVNHYNAMGKLQIIAFVDLKGRTQGPPLHINTNISSIPIIMSPACPLLQVLVISIDIMTMIN